MRPISERLFVISTIISSVCWGAYLSNSNNYLYIIALISSFIGIVTLIDLLNTLIQSTRTKKIILQQQQQIPILLFSHNKVLVSNESKQLPKVTLNGIPDRQFAFNAVRDFLDSANAESLVRNDSVRLRHYYKKGSRVHVIVSGIGIEECLRFKCKGYSYQDVNDLQNNGEVSELFDRFVLNSMTKPMIVPEWNTDVVET